MRASRSINFGKRLATIAIASVAMCASLVPAHAGPAWDFANNTLSNYYGNKYGVPDWNMSRDEFKNSWLPNSDTLALLHLGKEAAFEFKHDFVVVYSPATNEVKIWRTMGTNSGVQAPKQRTGEAAYFDCGFPMTYGSIELIGGVPTCIPGDSVGSASTSVYSVHVGTIPAQARECTFTGIHTHTC
jgi:hypothetical protein